MRGNEAWKKWGEHDPYYAVCSDPKFRREALAGNLEAFFRSGEEHIERRLDLVQRLYGSTLRRTAVDFGSGTGRLVLPLARQYARVIGVDISPAMTAEAKKNCAARGVTNVSFCEDPAEIPTLADDVDLVSSSIVLQHIRPEQGLVLMGRLLDSLSEGGIAALHVTVFRKGSRRRRAVYAVKHRVPGARVLFNLVQGKKLSEPLMQMNNYPLDGVLELFLQKGMTDLHLEPVFESSWGFVVYGRKGARAPR